MMSVEEFWDSITDTVDVSFQGGKNGPKGNVDVPPVGTVVLLVSTTA